jgi:hypothetical protein
MTNTTIVVYFFLNTLGMALSFFPNEIPYLIAAVVWSVGLAGLMTHIVLYTKLK